MIIDCISDLHGTFPKLEGGDLLLVAGDLTYCDTLNQHSDVLEWLYSLPYEKKVIIGGNHDNFLQKNPNFYSKTNVDYLLDSGTYFRDLLIWGSPWTKNFKEQNPKCKAFGLDSEFDLKEKWVHIPYNTNILLTHSPPYGKLDRTSSGKNVGSTALLDSLKDICNLKLNCFGHIHEAYGIIKGETTFINASINDECYIPINKPTRVVI